MEKWSSSPCDLELVSNSMRRTDPDLHMKTTAPADSRLADQIVLLLFEVTLTSQ
jgi:hypothetical protein